MSYTKQNFVSGQILKAEHLNHMEDGIETNDAAITQLSEDLNELKNRPMIYFNSQSRKYICNYTFAELNKFYDKLLSVLCLDTMDTPGDDLPIGNYRQAIDARIMMSSDGTNRYIEFAFLNHERDGYDIFKVNSDDTVTLVSE